MKKLTEPTKVFYLMILLFLISTLAVGWFILNFEIERSIKLDIFLDEDKNFWIKNPDIYWKYIEIGKKINVNYLDKVYTLKIVGYSKFNDLIQLKFAKIPQVISSKGSTSLAGTLVYDQIKILNLLLSI
ncbi:MAG1140 family protein [Mycoplasma simbae]|uniref:MAG1140 family protein n=1 Tax=Mycoplasma simbae TaxID=36744 RepID=UPI000497F26B|nr:hypothetical protein [Mycoplasma simbae]